MLFFLLLALLCNAPLIHQHQDEGTDGWSTVLKKNGETGFVPTAFLEKSKQKRKGTLFGKKKGSSDPAPSIPSFGTSSAKEKETPSTGGKRRFATARRGGSSMTPTTLADVGARYTEDDPNATPTPVSLDPEPVAEPSPVVEHKPPLPPKGGRDSTDVRGGSGDSSPVIAPKAQPPAASGGPGGSTGHSGPMRKGGGKLANNPFLKKDANKTGMKKSGPKRIVVKRASQQGSALSGRNSDPSSPNPKRIPDQAPPEPSNARYSQGPLSASTPNIPKVEGHSRSMTVRGEEIKAAIVSTETLEQLAKMNDRRTNIMREMYETEKSYVRNLKEICTLYMDPMKDTKWKDHVNKLFSNVHLIVTINDELLEGLNNTIQSWNTETSLVGPVFQKMAPFMRLYNTYGNSYNEALSVLHKLREKTDFCDWVQSQRSGQPLDLEALLIQPVQRIPRYRMLLEDMLKNTCLTHPDRSSLESSLKNIQDVATDVNESIRATEQAKKIGEQLGLQKYIAPHRKLLNEAMFSAKLIYLPKDKIKGSVDVAVYLFNDLFVMFFQKPIKLKDNRRHDFSELAWPHTLIWPSLEGKASFRVIGPSYSILFSSKEKDSTAGGSQVAGFHQKLVDVSKSEIPESPAGRAKKPDVRTPGTNFGVYEFLEGMRYTGEWKEGLPWGKGMEVFAGGLTVEGSFDAGQKHGECTITYPSGEVFKGACQKGDLHGPGQIVWPNGDTYRGYWLGGRRDGEGTFACAYYKYDGNWSDGLMDGEGQLTFNGGGFYQGKFKEGKFNGEGTLVRGNGVRTKGTWVQGVQEGEGEEFYPENMSLKQYQGSFSDNKRNGGGTMFYRDGAQYKGEYKDGMRHGRGILTCPARPIMRYEGTWASDQFDGRGEVFFSTKDRYVGSFSAGCMHGAGVYSYNNGTQIAGEWKNGIRQRKITLTRSDANERFEVEITASKDRAELGDAKYGGKLMTYYMTPVRPEMDQVLLEAEVIPEAESDVLRGTGGPRKSSLVAVQAAIEEISESPTMSARGDRPRSTSFLGALKRK